jgi:hypothetical protein
MKKNSAPRIMAAVLLWALPTAVSARPVPASGAGTVIAKGLNNPRGLAIGPDGSIYVAEAGSGGKGPCVKGESGPACFGLTGAIARIQQGKLSRIVTGLPSVAGSDGSESSGPLDVTVAADGSMNLTIQGVDMATPRSFGKAGALLQHLVHVNADGTVHAGANLYSYEKANNPDRGEINSDPCALVTQGTQQIVADAAANDLLAVNATGNISTLAVLPSRMAKGPGGKQIPMETVPDSLAVGPDGAYYVGELTGFPFPVGGARIYRVQPGHKPTVYATGFTNIISLAFGPDRSLYVLEIFKGGLGSVDPKKPASTLGAVIRLAPDGTRTTIASDGLVAPAGLAVSSSGEIYVSNFGIFSGAGQVVRITP